MFLINSNSTIQQPRQHQQWMKSIDNCNNNNNSNNNGTIRRLQVPLLLQTLLVQRRLLISIIIIVIIILNLLQIVQLVQIPVVHGRTYTTGSASTSIDTRKHQQLQLPSYGWIQTRKKSSEYDNSNNDRKIPKLLSRRKKSLPLPVAFVVSPVSSLIRIPLFKETDTTSNSFSTTRTTKLLLSTVTGSVPQSVVHPFYQKQEHRPKRQRYMNHNFCCKQSQQQLFFRSSTTTASSTTSRLFSSSLSTEKEIEKIQLMKRPYNNKNCKYSIISINECIGSGSYGTVHALTVKIIVNIADQQSKEDDDNIIVQLIGKRHWNQTELLNINMNNNQKQSNNQQKSIQLTDKIIHEKYQRCQYYWTIEKDCYETLFFVDTTSSTTDSAVVIETIHNHTPNYIGTDSTNTWMLWEPIIINNQQSSSYSIDDRTSTTTTTPVTPVVPLPPISSLAYYLEQDRIYKNTIPISNNSDAQQQQRVHDLHITSKALFPSLATTTKIPLSTIIETVLTQLLQIVSTIHSEPYQIVHRDIKPSNILINNSTGQLILIDFGSASILSSSTSKNENIFQLWSNNNNNNDNIVAVSPIYTAPEIFINNRNDIESILKFDIYSIGILIIQLLFQYTDERLISSFKQQLLACDYNIDIWLQQQLQSSKVRPIHIVDAIYVLQYYPGVWTLLQHMLYPSPTYDSNNNNNQQRISSIDAYNRWMNILQQKQQQKQDSIDNNNDKTNEQQQQQQQQQPTTMFDDGPYIQEVFRFYGYRNNRGIDNNANDIDINTNDTIDNYDNDDNDDDECPLPMDDLISIPISETIISKATTTTTTTTTTTSIRPLHYVVTFSRSKSLGLILSEATGNDDDITFTNDESPEQNQQHTKLELWNNATIDALPGQVFIQDIVPNGQADTIGIFHIGDRFHGVGDLSFNNEGFERAVQLIQDQPRDAKFITLHFDRKPLSSASSVSNPMLPSSQSTTSTTTDSVPLEIVDQGAWVSKGKRSAQEDAFVLQAIQVDDDTGTSDNSNSYLLAGVFDGHLGSAASLFVQNELPQSFRNELLTMTGTRTSTIDKRIVLEDVVQNSWEQICTSYRDECQRIVTDDGSTSCAAEYDPVNGILMASTGSKDAIAGTTAVLFVIDKVQRTITTLNCGDSRGLLLDNTACTIVFQTNDHTPQYDFNRFVVGINSGYDYCIPKCNKRTNTWRVEVGDYDYAVARSLEGNFATSKGIVSTPDIITIPLPVQFDNTNNNNNNNDSRRSYVLVLATDGFWEVIDSEEATKIIVQLTRNSTNSNYKQHQQQMSASDIAKYLCTLAIQKGSSDNVSVIIVFIK